MRIKTLREEEGIRCRCYERQRTSKRIVFYKRVFFVSFVFIIRDKGRPKGNTELGVSVL